VLTLERNEDYYHSPLYNLRKRQKPLKKNNSKRKRKVKQIIALRQEINPSGLCKRCGEKIGRSPHHFYCSECWKPMQLVMVVQRRWSRYGERPENMKPVLRGENSEYKDTELRE